MSQRLYFFVLFFLFSFSASAGDFENEALLEYLPMDPDFVINLQGNRRSYLRARIQLLVEGKEQSEKIKTHMPALRHGLIMLISEYSAEQLGTSEQREEFRRKALSETHKMLDRYASSEGLTDLFFTEFLVQ